MYMGGKLWDDLLAFVQKCRNIESVKHNCKCTSVSLGHGRIDIYAFVAICRFLYDTTIICGLYKNSTVYMDMDFVFH